MRYDQFHPDCLQILQCCEVYAPTSHGSSATCEPFIFRGEVRAFQPPHGFGGQAVVSWNIASDREFV